MYFDRTPLFIIINGIFPLKRVTFYLINVIKRIKHLQIKYPILSTFKFEMTNLTELTLNHGYFRDEIIINKITFPNVTKLNIRDLDEEDFDKISKFSFLKLKN